MSVRSNTDLEQTELDTVKSREEELNRDNVQSGMTDSDIEEAEAEMDEILRDLVRSTTSTNLEQTEVDTVRSREEELLTEDPEAWIDGIMKHVQKVSSIIEEQQKADSPLNELVSSVPTDKIQPDLFSFWDRVATVDISDPDSRRILVEMFVELIGTVSNLILDSFRNIVLSERHTHLSPLVSEKAVHKALHKSLSQSFKAVLGSTHRSMEELIKLVSSEVASRINSVLSSSQVQDNHLVVTDEADYKTPRDKLKAMLRYVRDLSRLTKGKISQSCQPCGDSNQPEEVCEDTTAQHLVEKEQKKEEDITLKAKCCAIKFKLLQKCCPCVHSEEEEEMANISTPDKNYTKLASPTTSLKAAIKAVKEILEKEASNLETFRDHQLTREDQAELLRSLSNDSQDIAAFIMDIIVDSSKGSHAASAAQDDPTKKPCLQGLDQKIKSFFVLYFAKDNFHGLLSSLCCLTSARCAASVQIVMEEASPILKELVSGQAIESQGREVCVYERVSQGITKGLYQELSWQLRNLILKFMTPRKGQKGFIRKVGRDVDTFMVNILRWINIQQQQPAGGNPVQRVLRRIHRLAFNMATPALDTNQPMIRYMQDNYPPTFSVAQRLPAEEQSLMESVQKVPKATTQKATSAGQDVPKAQSRYLWDPIHCTGLVYEISKLVLQKRQGPELNKLCISLELLLEPKIAEWDIQVKPCDIKKVAKAVFSDLCLGRKKGWLQRDTYTMPEFNTIIMDSIYKNLVKPQKTSRFSSFQQSVHNAFCPACRGR